MHSNDSRCECAHCRCTSFGLPHMSTSHSLDLGDSPLHSSFSFFLDELAMLNAAFTFTKAVYLQDRRPRILD